MRQMHAAIGPDDSDLGGDDFDSDLDDASDLEATDLQPTEPVEVIAPAWEFLPLTAGRNAREQRRRAAAP